MTQFAFGAGNLYGVRQDVANSTPIRFGAFQEVQLDISGDVKELYGQNAFALDIARGKMKIEGKAKFGQLNARIYNDLFFGNSLTAGQILNVDAEAASVPATTAYTVTAANGANFNADQGVRYAATGQPLKLVTALTAAGQYTVNNGTGVYTFYSGDASAAVVLSYSYKSSATGNTISLTNQLMGSLPTFQASFFNTYKGKTLGLILYACVAPKLSFPTKLDDYAISEIDFQAQDPGSGIIGTLSLSE